MNRIEKAAVLGAGTMGAQIAAHLANAGIPTLLLDIPPRELTAEEGKKGLTLESKEVRDRIARAGLEAAKKARPAAFFTAEKASLVSVGNFDDDMARLKDCDFIVEAVVENLEIKRSLYERVEQFRRPGSVVASNTSGIPIRQLAEGRSEDFRAHFLGTHFFNPPRYLHLVEIIRTEWTKPEVSCSLYGFLDQRLGKGVVVAKDRPNFIANRIGTYGALVTIKTMLEDGYSIEEVDKMTGQAVGRPKSATFRTFDIVGLDVFAHVAKNLYEAVPEDEDRDVYLAPEFVTRMVERGILGNKTRGGFYKKQKAAEGEKPEIWTLDHASLEYRPQQKAKLPALDVAKNIEDTGARLRALVWGKDRVGAFLWKTISKTLQYAANRIPEVADTVVEVDRAMRWGFNWELGVFEVWDAIGVEKSVARLREEGRKIPENVERMIAAGATSFYKKEDGQELYFDFASGKYVPLAPLPGVTVLKSVKERSGVVKKNAGASLVDLGDGVAGLEFHSKMNAIGGDTLQMIKQSLAEVEKNFVGLVVGNQGQNFSVGANLMLMLLEAQEENWEDLDLAIRAFQNATMSLQLFGKAGRRRAVPDDLRRRVRDDFARRPRARFRRDLHRSGGSWRRVDSGGRRDKRDAGARARLDPQRRDRRRRLPLRQTRVRDYSFGESRDLRRGGALVRLPARRGFVLDEPRPAHRRRQAGSALARRHGLRPAAAADRHPRFGRQGSGDSEARHPSDEARRLHLRARRAHRREAGAHLNGRRPQPRDARLGAVSFRPRT